MLISKKKHLSILNELQSQLETISILSSENERLTVLNNEKDSLLFDCRSQLEIKNQECENLLSEYDKIVQLTNKQKETLDKTGKQITELTNRNQTLLCLSDEQGLVITDYRKKLDAQSQEITELTVSKQKLLDKYAQIIDIEEELQKQRTIFDDEAKQYESTIDAIKSKKQELELQYQTAIETYNNLKKIINLYDAQQDLLEYGVYEPIFSYSTTESFKNAIHSLKEKQKLLISLQNAAVCANSWTVNGKLSQGRTMVNHQIKLVLCAFNSECDAIISKVRWNNISRCKDKIQDIYERLNKLESINKISITQEYLQSKFEELDLYFGLANLTYSIKMQERALREERKEEEKAQREIEQEMIRAEREEIHYQKALSRIKAEIEHTTGVRYEQLAEKIKYYEEELAEARMNKERAISMAQQTRRGYVYIISNIGSFGENVYKIGLTRRLDPEDRIRELSNASVPFKFDIHAMIYSEDAPSLESMLHNAFDEQKINLVNGRKEFFRVSLEDIQNKIEESGINAQFVKIAEARDYRESERMRNKETIIKEVSSDFPVSLFDTFHFTNS